jgi:hypothetical protein
MVKLLLVALVLISICLHNHVVEASSRYAALCDSVGVQQNSVVHHCFFA